MEVRIAKVISYIFHPLLLPLYAVILILQLDTLQVFIIPENARWLMIGMIAIATVVFPVLLTLLFVRGGLIQSMKLDNRQERLYPYIIMAVIYYSMYLLFKNASIPSIFNNFMLGVTLILIVLLLINFRWKISIHMAGIGGLTGAFTGIAIRYYLDIIVLILIVVFIAGVVGFARLKLNTHKEYEVYTGYVLGLALMLAVYLIM